MNDKRQPPTIITAVCSTVMGMFALAGCFAMVKSDGPNFLAISFIVLNLGLIALAVLGWVLYFRAHVDFRIDQLRQEPQSLVSQPPSVVSQPSEVRTRPRDVGHPTE